jgi:hypothetical protein
MVEKDIRLRVMAISSTIEISRLQMTSRVMLSMANILTDAGATKQVLKSQNPNPKF